ncbi:hypothetical protein AAVH_16590 [Aphelenchoides avenae]|nr:hypothetical protein AAVH_16590 [Aphelenchus avenae]
MLAITVFYLFAFATTLSAQQLGISAAGKLSCDGKPAQGATVEITVASVKNGVFGAKDMMTGADGAYSLDAVLPKKIDRENIKSLKLTILHNCNAAAATINAPKQGSVPPYAKSAEKEIPTDFLYEAGQAKKVFQFDADLKDYN